MVVCFVNYTLLWKVVGFTMSSYDVECEGCSKEVTITGAYIGKFEDVWCEKCGYEGELLEGGLE